jgi:peptidoglycan/LPS O-acetylase OafA/YrhL
MLTAVLSLEPFERELMPQGSRDSARDFDPPYAASPDHDSRGTSDGMPSAAVNHRFVVLDGFRGLAAVSVVLYHASTALGIHGLAARAYLAVDFFFVLSGFVLAYAYEARLRMRVLTPPAFFALRFKRLWAVAAAGTVLGLVATLLGVSGMPFRTEALGASAAAFIFGALLLPDLIPGAPAFPLNPPHWSIFFEIAANYVYAVAAPALSRRILGGGVLIAGAWLTIDTLVSGNANHISAARVAYGFFAGVAIYRAWASGVRPALGSLTLGLLLASCLFVPSPIGAAATDAFLQLVALPLIVWAGASAVAVRSRFLCRWAGRLSYPLYALHYPVLMALLWR